MAKPFESAQIEFIKDCIRKGEQRKDILQKFAKKYKTSIKTFDNRLKAAQTSIRAELATISEQANISIANEVEARTMKILSSLERQAILTEIALGELEAEHLVVTKEGIKKVKVKPTHADIKSAVAELNKMAGDYAPAKQNITINKIGIDADIYE